MLLKAGSKPTQHFIQHASYGMLDEMLDRFKHFQNLWKKKKSCWMTKVIFVKSLCQHYFFAWPTTIFSLDWFERGFHLTLRHLWRHEYLHIFSNELNSIEFELHRITSNVYFFIIFYDQRQRNFLFLSNWNYLPKCFDHQIINYIVKILQYC